MSFPTPSEFADRLNIEDTLLTEVIDGLSGQPFSWNADEYESRNARLKESGITLVTTTDIKNLGGLLHKHADPVGSIYFPPPVSGCVDVYILECQVWVVQSD
jgi:hypothetical protein